jgi:uncharacterized membrane protein YgcG
VLLKIGGTSVESKTGLYGAAYVEALTEKLGFAGAAPVIASGAPAVITVVFNDGTKESFVHLATYSPAINNLLIPGTQKDAQGNTLCPASSSGGGSGSGGGDGQGGLGGTGGSGGGGGGHIVCYDSYANGKYNGTDCYEEP